MKTYNVTVNGVTYSVVVEEVGAGAVASAPVAAPTAPVAPKAAPAVPAAVPAAPAAPTAGCVLKSPLPGTILDIFVNAGDTVKAGQHLILLEAMKMENNIDADRDGVVKEIRVRRSDSVMEGDVLLVIE